MKNIDDIPTYFSTKYIDVEKYKALLDYYIYFGKSISKLNTLIYTLY